MAAELSRANRNGASLRDPAGQIFQLDDQVWRGLSPEGDAVFRRMKDQEFYARLVQDGLLVAGEFASAPPELEGHFASFISHPRLPLVVYPYELPFSALKAAALLHLKIHRELLQYEYDLIDASAYNVQFLNTRPIFIDTTSIVPYSPRPWRAYRQFCQEFLFPLLLGAHEGIDFQPFFRGRIDGIDADTTLRLLSLRNRLRPSVFIHAVVQRWSERKVGGGGVAKPQRPMQVKREVFDEMLAGLQRTISALSRHTSTRSVWSSYSSSLPYENDEMKRKREFVAKHVCAWKPQRLLDLGCNTGDFSLLALESGAKFCIGAESDAVAADIAYLQAKQTGANFIPLVIDLLDPSPARGWNGQERASFMQRAAPDTVLALALVHHIAIKGIRLEEIVRWLIGLAPRGIVEFVPPSDPMVQRMLLERGIVLDDISIDGFAAMLAQRCNVLDRTEVSPGGRTLFAYESADRPK